MRCLVVKQKTAYEITRARECRRVFFFSSRRRHTRLQGDWSSDVCSSDLRRSTTIAFCVPKRLCFGTENLASVAWGKGFPGRGCVMSVIAEVGRLLER